ncbi:hypothetical protein HY570_01795 [Candidatus Micrarchaeota archaeon]|nr:hypothetical protein [Candidatus Micrarchaeota archaeon]
MKIYFIMLIFLSFLVLGCTEEEQKQIGQEIIKQAIDDANPLKPKGNETIHKEECDTSFKCSWDTVVKVSCETGKKVQTELGPSYEYCDPYYYVRVSCESGTLTESGQLEENTYCLVQNTQLGRSYCKNGQIKREITMCSEGTTCILTNDKVHKCIEIPKSEPDKDPFVDCPLDFRGRCPSNCVQYFGRCVYPP